MLAFETRLPILKNSIKSAFSDAVRIEIIKALFMKNPGKSNQE